MVRGVFACALLVAAIASCTPSSSAGDAGVSESCADVPATACFANDDCPAGQRCVAPANADPTISVTCCLAGARGTADAGSPCQSMNDCQAGVCTYTPSGPLCTRACQADSDCPVALPSCVTVDAASRFCGLAP